MTYPQQLLELIEEFKELGDKRERIEYLFEFATEVNELPRDEWTDETRVRGCQSEAHIRLAVENDIVHFESAADAQLVQGLMGILTIAIEGQTTSLVLELTPDFASEMGILTSLSPSRSNGFRNMFDKIQQEVRNITG
jgi:cysteine desulfuration protein SufE